MYGETDIDLGNASQPGPRYPGGGTNRFGLSSSSSSTGFATGGLNLYRSQGVQLQGKKGSDTTPTFEYQFGVWQGQVDQLPVQLRQRSPRGAQGRLPPVGLCRLESRRRCRGQRAVQTRSHRLGLLRSRRRTHMSMTKTDSTSPLSCAGADGRWISSGRPNPSISRSSMTISIERAGAPASAGSSFRPNGRFGPATPRSSD